MLDSNAADKNFILRRATAAEFGWTDEPEHVCLIANRRISGRAQCAIVHRRNIRSPFPAVYPVLAQAVREEFYPGCDGPAIDWWEIQITVDADARIRYVVKRVSMTIADGIYNSATMVDVDDATFNDWAGFVELGVTLALKRHIL